MSENIPESIPTSDSRPAKRARTGPASTLSSKSSQANQVEALFADPDRALQQIENTSSAKQLAKQASHAPPEIVANVQGSSAGAGSGEFHVYKASRRREYERLRRMDDEAEDEEKDKAWREGNEKARREDEERLERNRKKREKLKARQGKGKKGGGTVKGEVEEGNGMAPVGAKKRNPNVPGFDAKDEDDLEVQVHATNGNGASAEGEDSNDRIVEDQATEQRALPAKPRKTPKPNLDLLSSILQHLKLENADSEMSLEAPEGGPTEATEEARLACLNLPIQRTHAEKQAPAKPKIPKALHPWTAAKKKTTRNTRKLRDRAPSGNNAADGVRYWRKFAVANEEDSFNDMHMD